MFLSDLLPDLTMEVPNLTDVQGMRALGRAARRFYSDTLLWQDRRTYSLAEGATAIRLRLPIEECTLKTVNRVYFEGEELRPITEQEYVSNLDSAYSDHPIGFIPSTDGLALLIAPPPRVRQDNSYAVNAIYIPTIEADELPLDMHSEFEPAYVAGALAYLYATGTFLNPALADVNEGRYQEYVIQAQNKRDRLYEGYAKTVSYGGL